MVNVRAKTVSAARAAAKTRFKNKVVGKITLNKSAKVVAGNKSYNVNLRARKTPAKGKAPAKKGKPAAGAKRTGWDYIKSMSEKQLRSSIRKTKSVRYKEILGSRLRTVTGKQRPRGRKKSGKGKKGKK